MPPIKRTKSSQSTNSSGRPGASKKKNANLKSSSTGKFDPKPAREPGEGSEKLADRLAEIDLRLVKLLDERAKVLQRATSKSKSTAETALAETLWNQQQRAIVAATSLPPDTPLSQESVEEWMRHTASVCHVPISSHLRVAYLGPIYSYSYLAAAKHFGPSSNLAPVASIAAVFEEMIRHQSSFGVVPVENSTDGRVVDTLGLFARYPVHVCGEVLIPIHHCLLGRTPRSGITEVYSKPQALSQCRSWLVHHLPDARPVEVASTAAAARLAAERPGAAAIASREAGIHHGLEVIDENIEDNQQNVTRFFILGHQPAARTGNDKTALMFQVPHRPGALADAMLLFRKNKLNLTWIESFPLAGSRKEYLFFTEIEGHQTDAALADAIQRLREQAIRLEVLGSYPQDDSID